MADPLRVFIAGDGAVGRAELARQAAAAGLIVVSDPALADLIALSPEDWSRLHARRSAPGARSDEAMLESLTPREREVLALVADGLHNREIAGRLGVSEHTVKFHLGTIFGKLGASTRTEAVQKGLRLGLIAI